MIDDCRKRVHAKDTAIGPGISRRRGSPGLFNSSIVVIIWSKGIVPDDPQQHILVIGPLCVSSCEFRYPLTFSEQDINSAPIKLLQVGNVFDIVN